MIQETPQSSSPAKRHPIVLPLRQVAGRDRESHASLPQSRWLRLVQGVGIGVFLGIPLFLLLFQPPVTVAPPGVAPWLGVGWPGGRYVWTLIIALLPLAIVLM